VKQIWQRFQAPFAQSEFVPILTKIFLSSVVIFSVDSLGITVAGKVAVWNTHVNVYYRNNKTFVVSFQICGRLFVFFTMTSLGSRKRPFRHRVRCEVCQKQLDSDNKESHIKAKHHGKRVKFSKTKSTASVGFRWWRAWVPRVVGCPMCGCKTYR